MKIFYQEKQKEIVYVQLNDILFLKHCTDIKIPESIYVYTAGEDKNSPEDKVRFILFDASLEVQFFKDIDFIIDYADYKDMTEDQLCKEISKYVLKANKIIDKKYSMSEKSENYKKINQNLQNIRHILEDLFRLEHFRSGLIKLDIPNVV